MTRHIQKSDHEAGNTEKIHFLFIILLVFLRFHGSSLFLFYIFGQEIVLYDVCVTVRSCRISRFNPVNFLSFSRRLSGPSGYIHDGLGNYSVGVKCSWLIDARNHTNIGTGGSTHRFYYPDDQVSIRLHFEEFATECSWDHLYVFDGDSVESPLLGVFR